MAVDTTASASLLRRLCLPAILALAPAARAQALLATASESQDGEVRDLAAAQHAAAPLDERRVWIAQGRVRAALRASDGARVTAEDRVFPLPGSRNQDVRAVAVDDEAGVLYTLTDRELYRETWSAPFSQSALGDERRLVLPAGESALDVQTIAPGWCAVLTASRIHVVQSGPAGLALASATAESLPLESGGSDPALDALQVFALRRMTILRDETGEYVALCRVGVARYGLAPRLSVATPFPQALVACRLGRVEDGFAAPSFDFDPGRGRHFVWWDPYAASPALAPGQVDERAWHAVYDLAVRALPGGTRVYAACGRRKQIRELAWVPGPAARLVELRTIPVLASQDVFVLRFDPQGPGRMHARGTTRLFTLDADGRALGAQTAPAPMPVGGLGDAAIVEWRERGRPRARLWSAGASVTDTLVRAFDLDGLPARESVRAGGLWRSDGAVATGPDDVYTPTWGAVTHYRRLAGRWTPVQTQPTNLPGPFGFVHATEQIALAEVAPGDRRVLVAGNHSLSQALVEMPLGPAGELRPARVFGTREVLQAEGWDPRVEDLWSNDVAPLRTEHGSYALLDLSNGTRGCAALVAYRFDAAADRWDLATWRTLRVPPPAQGVTTLIEVAEGLPGRWFAFVGHDSGFFSVDLGGLRSTPAALTPVTTVWSPVPGRADRHVGGLAVAGDRLVVCFNNRDAVGGGATPEMPTVQVFRWDRATGAVQLPAERVYRPTEPSDPLYHAGYYRAFRSRFLPDAPGADRGRVLLGNTGFLYELRLDPGASAGPLSLSGLWKGAYSNAIQDVRPYDFGAGPQVLVSKDSEAFAWVLP